RMDRAVVKHTYREQNRVTDALAKEATKTTFLNRSSILAVPSMFANDAFWADILGTDFVRIFVGCNMEIILQNIASVGVLQYPNNDLTV
ncbi:hypothetical protein A4A49_56186, partial [Nicotiana attenuata]